MKLIGEELWKQFKWKWNLLKGIRLGREQPSIHRWVQWTPADTRNSSRCCRDWSDKCRHWGTGYRRHSWRWRRSRLDWYDGSEDTHRSLRLHSGKTLCDIRTDSFASNDIFCRWNRSDNRNERSHWSPSDLKGQTLHRSVILAESAFITGSAVFARTQHTRVDHVLTQFACA